MAQSPKIYCIKGGRARLVRFRLRPTLQLYSHTMSVSPAVYLYYMTKSDFRSSWSDCGTAIVTFREISYNNPSGFENSTGELNTRTVLNTGTYFTSKFLLYNSIKTTVSMTTSTAVRGGNVEFRGSLQSRILSDFKISKALHCTCG